jgi:hypothetical protein
MTHPFHSLGCVAVASVPCLTYSLALCSTKMSVKFSESIRLPIPEDSPLHKHWLELLKTNLKYDVGFEVPTAEVMTNSVFYSLMPYSPLKISRVSDDYVLGFSIGLLTTPENGGNIFLRNIGCLPTDLREECTSTVRDWTLRAIRRLLWGWEDWMKTPAILVYLFIYCDVRSSEIISTGRSVTDIQRN